MWSILIDAMKLVRTLILGLLSLFFLVSLTRNFFEYRRNLQFYESYKQNYEQVKHRNNELKSELVKNKDPYQVEKTIRDRLNLSKGKEVAVLMNEPSPTPTVLTPTPIPNHVQWWNTLFGN